jgi:RNA exonuclease 1
VMGEGAAMAVLAETEEVQGEGSTEQQTKVNRRMLKKKKRLLTKGKGTRSDYFDVYGAQARAELVLQPPTPNARLSFQDLQGLVTWVLADGESPKWAFVKNKPLVTKVVMLHMPGLDAALYMEHPSLCKSLTHHCGVPRAAVGVSPMATPAQTVEALFSCPKPRRNKVVGLKREGRESSESEDAEDGFKRRKVENVNQGNRRSKDQASFPASYYTLTARQMHENGYPKFSLGEEILPGFVRTVPAPESVTPLEIVAVDCEMCYTCEGLELTRVSMVGSQGEVLLDKLVKPENPITNYNTQYSGITAAMMAGVGTTLTDVQEEILHLVHAETILVGHSVENDLVAMKVLHSLVIDTALLYHHPSRGPMCKPALRMLTGRYLKRKIQGDKAGHDSVEDARAAMDLVLLKISKGPGFGTRMKPNTESLVEVLSRHGRRSSLVDRRPMLHQYAVGSCNAIIASSDDDVCAKAVKEVRKPAVDFVWAQFTDLNAYHEDRARATEDWSSRMAEMAATMTCSKTESKDTKPEAEGACEGLQTALARLDDRFKKVYDALEPNSLLIVATGHGDTASVRRLQELKWKTCQNKGAGSEWTRANEDVLEEFAARAETTLAFTCIK